MEYYAISVFVVTLFVWMQCQGAANMLLVES